MEIKIPQTVVSMMIKKGSKFTDLVPAVESVIPFQDVEKSK